MRESKGLTRLVRGWSDARGSTLLYVIGAVTLLAALGAGIAVMSPSAIQSKLEQEAGMRAFYNAQSGLNFILSMKAANSENGNGIVNFVNAMGGNNTTVTYNLPNNGQFTYALYASNVNGLNGSLTISNLAGAVLSENGAPLYTSLIYGGSHGSSGSSDYNATANNTNNSINSGSNYTLMSTNSSVYVAGNAIIIGNIYGANVTTEQANLTGNVVSQGNTTLNYNTYINGNVCSGSNATLTQTVVTGSVSAAKDVYLNYGVQIGGSVYSGGNVVMSSSVTVGGAVHAQGSVQLSYGDSIGSNVYANGNITFNGASATISGNAYSGSSIVFTDTGSKNESWGSKIVGKAVAASSISLGDGTSVGSSTISSSYPPNVKPTAPTSCSVVSTPKAATYTAGTTNIPVAWGVTTYSTTNPLPPGKYKDLTLSGGSPLTLKAGIYYFNSISIGWGSTLNLDVSGGDITIFVVGTADINATAGINVSTDGSTWKTMATVDKSYAARVYLEAHSAITLEWGVNWFGTLFSTNSITFGGGNTIIGAYATTGTNTLSWAASVTYVESDYAKSNW
jgi:predicted acyltransferase (DUF342 family)